MLKLVIGSKGKGKTKYMLETANNEAKTSDGLVIYLDKNSKHIFELDKHIRLINVREYPVPNLDVLLGFICGLISGNHDIETIYFDSFMTLANLETDGIGDALNKMVILSDKLNVEFVLSLSFELSFLPDEYKEYVVTTL